MAAGRVSIGIDTGGTFTDFVVIEPSGVRIHKVPSTPANPARAVLSGLQEVLPDNKHAVVHGSTVATNAILERKGAHTVLVTTRGFEDVIEIGRQIRTSIYDLNVTKTQPLIDVGDRIGIAERVGPKGEVIQPLDDDDVLVALESLRNRAFEAVAICFLHSYANPEHEKRIAAEIARQFDGFISISHEVLPEFREYERCSTTVINSYVGPIMKRYLSQLAGEIGEANLRIMQSNGGVVSASTAGNFAVQTVLSGPAGGVVGGFNVGRLAGYPDVITFDMGGTSTDVCLCPGEIGRSTESSIGDLPIRVPVIDIHTVGAGGGSIASRDPGGSLKVGPQSAGADPGPICYSHGGSDVTVTDANLVLGRLSPDHFLGGSTTLDRDAAFEAVSHLAATFGMEPHELALGIVRVANATMERAIRVISLERGFDPRDFTLVCFGGAGGMHAAELARNLGIPRVLVPKGAGTLSALGMLQADFVRDYSQSVLVPADQLEPDRINEIYSALESRAVAEYRAEGIQDSQVTLHRSLDIRYVGQGFELSVPFTEAFEGSFHEAHERRYGYADPDRPVEVVHARVRTVGQSQKPVLPVEEEQGSDPTGAIAGRIRMQFDDEQHEAFLLDHDLLHAGNVVRGPALIVEYSTTTTVPPDFICRVDRHLNLVLERE